MFQIEFRNHPAQARHPFTKQALFDDNGKPVPLFPQQRSIWVDGVFCGYVGDPPLRNVAITRPRSQLGEALIAEIHQAVEREFGPGKVMAIVPEPIDVPIEQDEDE